MENGKAVRKKSGSASKKGEREERKVMQPIYAEEESIVCLRSMDMEKIEETQDCFILGFDPFHSDDDIHTTGANADLHVISQKGQVCKYAEEEPIVCLRSMDMEKIEETQDCFILGFDPFHSDDDVHATEANADLHVISQKGQVACRDYPHSRHQCVMFPFQKTPHERCCQLCYCYVCDSAAPCKYWTDPQPGHCHATEQDPNWKLQRKCR